MGYPLSANLSATILCMDKRDTHPVQFKIHRKRLVNVVFEN